MVSSPIAVLASEFSALSISDQWQLAEHYLQIGRLNQSLQLAYQIVQQDAAQQAQYYTHQQHVFRLGAEFAEEIGDYHRAAYYWEKVTQHQPDHAGAWYGLGIAQANLQQYPKAKQSLERSLSLNPTHENAQHNLFKVQQALESLR